MNRDGWVAVVLVLGAICIAASYCSACAAAKPAAEAAYLAEQLQCVDRAPTRPEADACRDAVKRRWDAGGDQ